MDITIQDIQQLQQEMGRESADLRLRAIVAERRVRELEARLAVVDHSHEAKEAAEDAE